MLKTYSKEILAIVISAVCSLLFLFPAAYSEKVAVPSWEKKLENWTPANKNHQNPNLKELFAPSGSPKTASPGNFSKAQVAAKTFKPSARGQRENPEGSLSLEGIIYDKAAGSNVIINGEILKPGGRVSGFVILEIKETEVILEKEGDRYRLSSKQGLVKLPSSPSGSAIQAQDKVS